MLVSKLVKIFVGSADSKIHPGCFFEATKNSDKATQFSLKNFLFVAF
jgi:hypothetical protein